MGLALFDLVATWFPALIVRRRLHQTESVGFLMRLAGVNAGHFALPTLTRVLYPFFFFFGFPFFPLSHYLIRVLSKGEERADTTGGCRNAASNRCFVLRLLFLFPFSSSLHCTSCVRRYESIGFAQGLNGESFSCHVFSRSPTTTRSTNSRRSQCSRT